MLGVLNPFEMEMSHRVFLWWKMYKEVKLTTLHDKTEYYFAKVIQAIAASTGNAISIQDALLTFKNVEEDTDEINSEESADAFITSAQNVKKRINPNGY